MPRRVIAYRNPFDLQLGLLNICKEPLLISEITRNANLSNSLAVRTLESLGSFGMIKSFSSEDVPRTFRLLGNSRNVFMRTEKGSDAIRLFEEIQTLFKEPVKNFKLALDVLIHLDNPSNQTGITSAVRRDAPTTRGAIENLTACGMIAIEEDPDGLQLAPHFVRTELGNAAAEKYRELLRFFVPTQKFDYRQIVQNVGKRN